MKRHTISSGSPYERPVGFARAVRIENRIIVSGTAPIADDGGNAFPGDAYQQSRRCLQIIEKAIEKAGGSMRDVVRTRVYLVNAQDWKAVGKAHGEVFGTIKPASTFVEVSALLDPDWLVEIEAEAQVIDD